MTREEMMVCICCMTPDAQDKFKAFLISLLEPKLSFNTFLLALAKARSEAK